MAKKILGFGNPVMDMMATVGDDTLAEWGAKLNDAILAEEKHEPLYAKLAAEKQIDYVAGGATLNTIRVAQWCMTAAGSANSSGYIGCIGKDAFGEKMKSALVADGVKNLFLEVDSAPTGTCAVLVKDAERSLVTKLGAAESYDPAHFESAPVQALLNESEVFYMAGYPITHAGGASTVKKIAEHALASNKTLCMNLSAPFLAMVPPFRETLLDVFQYCNYIFMNESEAEELAKQLGWDCAGKGSAAIAAEIAKLPSKRGGLKAVVTQGALCTVLAETGKEAVTYEVKGNPWTLTQDMLTDTNGAGDAFCGGFIAKLAAGVSDAECAKMGHFAAGTIIQQSGCTIPAYDKVSAVLSK